MINKKKVVIHFRDEDLELEVEEAVGIKKYFGLMFQKKDKSIPILFRSKKQIKEIHSFFVFFPFIALWMNKEMEVISFEIVKPFSFLVKPNVDAYGLLEVPI